MKPVCAFEMFAIIRFNPQGRVLLSCYHEQRVAEDIIKHLSQGATESTRYVIERAHVMLVNMDLTPEHYRELKQERITKKKKELPDLTRQVIAKPDKPQFKVPVVTFQPAQPIITTNPFKSKRGKKPGQDPLPPQIIQMKLNNPFMGHMEVAEKLNCTRQYVSRIWCEYKRLAKSAEKKNEQA